MMSCSVAMGRCPAARSSISASPGPWGQSRRSPSRPRKPAPITSWPTGRAWAKHTESYSIAASLIPFFGHGGKTGPGWRRTGHGGDRRLEVRRRHDFSIARPWRADARRPGCSQYQVSSTAFVKFDLTGQPAGQYTVQATAADGTTSQLVQALTVTAPSPTDDAQVYLSPPAGVIPGHQGDLTVNYVNEGNIDTPSPIIEITADHASMQAPGDSSFDSNAVSG